MQSFRLEARQCEEVTHADIDETRLKQKNRPSYFEPVS